MAFNPSPRMRLKRRIAVPRTSPARVLVAWAFGRRRESASGSNVVECEQEFSLGNIGFPECRWSSSLAHRRSLSPLTGSHCWSARDKRCWTASAVISVSLCGVNECVLLYAFQGPLLRPQRWRGGRLTWDLNFHQKLYWCEISLQQ